MVDERQEFEVPEKELPRWVQIPVGLVLGLFTLFCAFALLSLLLRPNKPIPILGFAVFLVLLLGCLWVLEKCFRLVTGRKYEGGLMAPATLRAASYFTLALLLAGLFTGYYRTMGPLAMMQALSYLLAFFGLRALARSRGARESRIERDGALYADASAVGRDRELSSELSDSVVAFVKSHLPSATLEEDMKHEPGVQGRSYHIDLPPPEGADYRFTLWLGSGEKQISACLLGGSNTYFWYMPFEEVSFRSVAQLNKAFIEVVDLLMRHPTRIQQRRGLFSHHFKCQYNSGGNWETIYRHAGLRWMGAPEIRGRRQVYQSPPLSSSEAPPIT
jgi:hypothetical protein